MGDMYSEYFGIRENAFSITPDPRFLFRSEQHCEALAHLLYGVVESGCFVLLTGEVGTGKTTICRTLLEQLPEKVDVALLLNPPQTGQELLLAITDELHIFVNHRDCAAHELVYLLTRRLLENHSQGRRTVVIIDEAQNIAPEVLEQVRLLTNLETRTEKLLHVFLVGQPELRDLLTKPSLRQVAQRITARYHLEPLSADETRDYIYHRLSVAGCRLGLFSEGAVRAIYRESKGVPRVINILCDRALLGAFASDKSHVTSKQISQAARQWRGKQPSRHFWSRYRVAAAVAAAGFLGTAAMVYAYVDELQNSMLVQAVKTQALVMVPSTVTAQQPKPVQKPEVAQQSAATLKQDEAQDGDKAANDTNAPPPSPSPQTLQSNPAEKAHGMAGSSLPAPTDESVNMVALKSAQASEAQPIPEGIRAIGPGSPPHAVRWLRHELDRIEGTVSWENGPLYDDQLRTRVMSLQRNNGLVVDGIAGPHTLNYMHVLYGTPVSSQADALQAAPGPRS